MRIYVRNLSTICLWMILGIGLWIGLGAVANKRKGLLRAWKVLNAVGMLAACYGILTYTVLNRVPSGVHQFVFCADYSDEFFREMLMNAFLYYPLGLTASVLIGPWSILAGFAGSLVIETRQYFSGTGVAQGTDVIMNTLGCAIGCIPWLIERRFAARNQA